MTKLDQLRHGPLGDTAIHICVDMQRMFAVSTEWKMPWLPRVLPKIETIVSAHPEKTVFTRFIPARRPRQGVGMWRHYYRRWSSMTIDELGPEMINLVPELAAFAPPGKDCRQICLFAVDRHNAAYRAAVGGCRYDRDLRRRNRCLRAEYHARRDRLGLPRHPRNGAQAGRLAKCLRPELAKPTRRTTSDQVATAFRLL
jgi:hypothetical protein